MSIKSLDILGIGFGPSNLALATAYAENSINLLESVNCLFLESNQNFSWHAGMLIPNMILQVPFLRDLATIRNPQSPFTFINYLKEKNRLDEFINLRTFYPTREEFFDYFCWAAEKLAYLVEYNSEVQSLSPVWDKKRQMIKQIKVESFNTLNQSTTFWYADNLVIAAGKTPYIPAPLDNIQDKRIIHTSQLLHKVPNLFPDYNSEFHFIVVGSGQSAGEAALYLLRSYPRANITLCFRHFSLCSIDNSPYVNQMYHQFVVEKFYQLNSSAKQKAHIDLKSSNYSVIDLDILREFYSIQYMDALNNKERLKLYPGLDLKIVMTTPAMLEVKFYNIFEEKDHNLKCDALILGTGYNDSQTLKLLAGLDPYLQKGTDDVYETTQDYQIKKDAKLIPNVYMQGYCESSHGPSDPTLAVLSTRAEYILNSICSKNRERMCELKNSIIKI